MNTDYFLTSTGERIPVICTHKSGARNIVLRPKVTPCRELHVSIPRWTSSTRATKFIEEKRRWLERIFERAPQKARICCGDVINFLGRDVLIRHDPTGKRGVFMEHTECGEQMTVCGAPEFLERRVRDEIKKQFLSAVKKELSAVPAVLKPVRIAIRDTTSRWGSCSSTGTISLSYRLAFAPPEIMKYVIMHELAHRKHMDHSPKFWALVTQLYGPGVERSKMWLSKNGQNLHKYF